MTKILFVCHGNICRSPMAEFILKDMARRAGVEKRFVIESAATSAEELGNPVDSRARRELAAHGVRCESRCAWRMTRADYDRFDLLIAMEETNVHSMLRLLGGDPEGKIRLLLSYTGRAADIDDPWYSGRFSEVYAQIERGCRALLDEICTHGM